MICSLFKIYLAIVFFQDFVSSFVEFLFYTELKYFLILTKGTPMLVINYEAICIAHMHIYLTFHCSLVFAQTSSHNLFPGAIPNRALFY